MKIEDLDSCNEAVSTDELILTHTNHTTEKITFEDLKESIGSVSELEITTELEVSGDTQLGDTTVTGDITQTGDAGITGDVTITGAVDVTGDTDIDGDVTITGDLDITGDIVQRGSAYETHAEKVYTKDDVINLRDGAVAALGNDEYAGLIAKHYDADGNDGALVFNKNGEARVGDYTEVTGTVYSSDGITFYSDSEMTQAATIPAGATPVQVEGNEYTYTVMVDDTEPLLTRSEAASMTDKAIIVWDGTNKRAVTTSLPAAANKVPVSQADGSFIWTDYDSGADIITASSAVMIGRTLITGNVIKVMFTAAITGSDIVTGLTLLYNNALIAVKVNKDGVLSDFTAIEVATSTYKYLQAYTCLELYYDGTYFVILGNPVVLSASTYKVYANGDIEHFYVKNNPTRIFNKASTSALQTFDLYTLGFTKDTDGMYLIGIELGAYDDDEYKIILYSDLEGENHTDFNVSGPNKSYGVYGTSNTRHLYINMKLAAKRYIYFKEISQPEVISLHVISVQPIKSKFIENF